MNAGEYEYGFADGRSDAKEALKIDALDEDPDYARGYRAGVREVLDAFVSASADA